MKNQIAIALGVLFGYGTNALVVWALIEFILYLVKDDPFNWWSLILIPIFIIAALLLGVLGVLGNR